MTDQDNSNSSDYVEEVNEDTLTTNFIRQYKKFKLGMLNGGALSEREQQSLLMTAMNNCTIIPTFLLNCGMYINKKMYEEGYSPDDVIECTNQFYLCMNQVICYYAIPWIGLDDEKKEELRAKFKQELDNENKESLAQLEFPMPDFDPNVNPDVNPE